MIISVTISPAFEYVAAILDWLWPVTTILAALGIGYIWGGCAQRG